jgi:hypothetical protein
MTKYLRPMACHANRILLAIAGFFLPVILYAQDKQVDVNVTTTKSSNWYAQPWVWIVGVAVFILLLVAILRSGRKD